MKRFCSNPKSPRRILRALTYFLAIGLIIITAGPYMLAYLSGLCLTGARPCEELPSYPGISSELTILQGAAAAEHGLITLAKAKSYDLIVLYQTVENHTGREFKIKGSTGFQFERLLVRNAAGEKVPLSEYGQDQKRRACQYRSRSATILLAGQSWQRAYNLSKLFDLSTAGTYTVKLNTQITLQNDGGIDDYSYCTNPDPVTFTVN